MSWVVRVEMWVRWEEIRGRERVSEKNDSSRVEAIERRIGGPFSSQRSERRKNAFSDGESVNVVLIVTLLSPKIIRTKFPSDRRE